MPTRSEIEAVARLMCRQNNENPDVHPGPVSQNSKPLWMGYTRKAERLLLEAEKVRGKRPRRCDHPTELREQYDGDAHWTCECHAEFVDRDTTQPLTAAELRDFKKHRAVNLNIAMTATETAKDARLS